MTQLPDDLLIAYQNFTLLATKYKMAYIGVMISAEPPALVAIGNVTQQGSEFTDLLRKYADIIDEKFDAGMVERSMFRDPQ